MTDPHQRSAAEEIRRHTRKSLVKVPLGVPLDIPSLPSHPARISGNRDLDTLHPPRPHAYRDFDYTSSSDSDEGASGEGDSVERASVIDQDPENPYNPFHDKEAIDTEVELLQQELNRVKALLVQTKTELALEQSRRPVEYDDRYFESQVTELRFNIRQWTRAHFSNSNGYMTSRAEGTFQALSRDWAAYLEDENWRPRLIQARLWDTLERRVFDVESEWRREYVFAGRKGGHALESMFAKAALSGSSDSRSAYREWRALTFSLLFPGKGRVVESILLDDIRSRVKFTTKGIWKSLRRYLSVTDEDPDNVRLELQRIIESAIYLDLDMRKHVEDITLYNKDKTLDRRFDAKRMEETVHLDADTHVGLILSPPLYKDHDLADGQPEHTDAQGCINCLDYEAVRDVPEPGISTGKPKECVPWQQLPRDKVEL
ncbi:hypothetical protein EJ04DRAFT_576069 [Polyplosphaeria fusca]|uniref:Uncharacterized protein n=1 Tax=Polyplosphaeria fusca TaxID=682080 RepID=A0A9P4QX73_9PLEO|nr:hypothetical protein EJ04DRAFT_576069 [Polyplosphaeria fusca]